MKIMNKRFTLFKKLIPNNLGESDVKVKKAYRVKSSSGSQSRHLRQVQMVHTKQKTEKHRYLLERRC